MLIFVLILPINSIAMINFPEAQILKRMVDDNPWWAGNSIFSEFDSMKPRLFLSPFMELVTTLPRGRSIILLGPRRVGKTVMIFHTIKSLLKSGVDSRKILYISVDSPLYSGMSLEDMLEMLLKAAKTDGKEEGYYVFLTRSNISKTGKFISKFYATTDATYGLLHRDRPLPH